MWEPDPAWLAVTGGTGTSTVGVWRTERGRPCAGREAARRARARRPAGVLRAPPLRLLAARRPTSRSAASCDATPGLRATPTDVGRGRRGHHADQRVGRGRRPQRAVRRARAWAGSPAPSSAGTRWLAVGPAARPDAPGGAARRLADPGPDDGRRRRRPPLVAARDAAARARRAAPGAAARRPAPRRTCPGATGDDVVAIDWSTLGHGPVGRRPRAVPAERPRGRRAAARRLPDGAARRGGHRARRWRSGCG